MGVAFGETRSNGGSSFGGDRGRDRQAQAQLYAGWNLGRGYALAQIGSRQFTGRWIANCCWARVVTVFRPAMAGASAVPVSKAAIASAAQVPR